MRRPLLEGISQSGGAAARAAAAQTSTYGATSSGQAHAHGAHSDEELVDMSPQTLSHADQHHQHDQDRVLADSSVRQLRVQALNPAGLNDRSHTGTGSHHDHYQYHADGKHSYHRDDPIDDVKPDSGDPNALTLSQYQQRVRERMAAERERSWFIRHSTAVMAGVCAAIAVLAVILGTTVFHHQLSPYYRDILEYGSIPVVSTVFTYCHIWLALWMTFYPLEFFGCYKPFLGWQGIIPAKAAVMATKAVDLMTQKLLRPEDVFARLEPRRVARILGPTLESMMGQLIAELGQKQFPGVWNSMPDRVKREVVLHACEEAPDVITAMMEDVKQNITAVFDLKHMVVSALVRDKALLNEMFLRCGAKEFRYIKVLGGQIGFMFGVLQMIVWFYYRAMWVLPVTGFLVGYLTNWIALKMIFQPVEPVSLLGCYTCHGLFLKRQVEVSAEYAVMVTERVLNASNIIEAIIRGPATDKLFAIMSVHIQAGIDKMTAHAWTKPLLHYVVGTEAYDITKQQVVTKVFQNLPVYMKHLESYTDEAMDMQNTLFQKMSALSSEEFERLLHPVFEEDEWKLIILGALLGVVVGLVQAFALGS